MFEAKYAGTCADCDGRINPGDMITYLGRGNAVHVKCPANVDKIGEVCDRCFMEKSVAGKCGCDE